MIELFEDNPDAEIFSTLGVGAIITLSIVSIICGIVFLSFTIFFVLYCRHKNCATRFLAGSMHLSIPAAPSPLPLRATAGRLTALSVPGVGAFANFGLPGNRAFANPGAGFLSEHSYTKDFTRKKSRLAHLSRTGKN